MEFCKGACHKVCLAIIVIVVILSACSQHKLAPAEKFITTATTHPVSPTESPQIPALKEASATPEDTLPTPTIELPTQTPELQPAPVVVISFDGAANQQVANWMRDGVLPTFSWFAESGLRAEAMMTIDPAVTAAAHASLVTGFYPDRTGIVSNLYHHPSDSFYWYRSGFNQPLDQVDPIWVTASQAGLKTAALFVAGGTPFLPGQTADFTIAYGARDAYSNQETLELFPIKENWSGKEPVSFSPPLEAAWMIPKVSQVYLYAYDSMDDNKREYDSLLINTHRAIDENALQLKMDEWEALVLLPSTGAGAHFLLQEIAPQGDGILATIYHTGVYHNLATPRSLLEDLDEQFGFFPASGDSYALEHGWITANQFLEMLDRSNQWMSEVTAWVYNTYSPDLLFTWLDAFDSAGHAFTPANPGEQGYDEAVANQLEAYLAQAASIADQSLNRLLEEIPLEDATIILVSDHGMAPVHTTLNLNKLLEDEGWLVLDDRDYVVVNQSRAIVFASGGSANIYINLEGRDRDGFVTEEEYEPLRQQIVESLSSLKNPKTGEVVFSRVLLREQLADLHLDHTHSGDIFAQANLGYDLDSHRGRWRLFEPTQFKGQHGYDCTLPEMEAIFIAAGAGVANRGQIIPAIHITDIALTITHLLGLPAENDMPGKVIFEMSTLP